MALTPDRFTPSRRSFLAGALGLGATALLAGCGDDGDAADSPGGADATFSFTDDRGKVVSGKRPRHVVAYAGAAAALWDFGVRPVGIFGPSKRADGSQDPQSGSVDLGKVTSVGNAFGEFNVEQYLTLQPDLLVSVMYDPQKLWYVPDDSAAKIEQLAPSVGIQLTKADLTDVIGKFAALSKALGADLESAVVKDARTAFDNAGGGLADAAKAAGGIRVMAVSASQDNLYVTIPEYYPDQRHYAERGVGFVVPTKPDASGFFETLSWENAAKYSADVIMWDARTQALTPEQLRSNPAWSKLPAVVAGQLVPWKSEAQYSYQGFTGQQVELATALRGAKKVT